MNGSSTSLFSNKNQVDNYINTMINLSKSTNTGVIYTNPYTNQIVENGYVTVENRKYFNANVKNPHNEYATRNYRNKLIKKLKDRQLKEQQKN